MGSEMCIRDRRSSDYQPVTMTEAQLDSSLHVDQVVKFMDKLYPLVSEHTQTALERMRQTPSADSWPTLRKVITFWSQGRTSTNIKSFSFGGVGLAA